MENYICINGQKIELTQEQVAQLSATQEQKATKLEDIPEGGVFKIDCYDFVVLQQGIDGTAVILKDPLPVDVTFGANNNYNGSNVDEACQSFAQNLAELIGEDGIFPHNVDLISNDGLKDYGVIERKASALTAERYRRYVGILDQHKPDRWWWLATPDSTETHECAKWVLCVSPRGSIYNGLYFSNVRGVRPFCILKSDIFVSM